MGGIRSDVSDLKVGQAEIKTTMKMLLTILSVVGGAIVAGIAGWLIKQLPSNAKVQASYAVDKEDARSVSSFASHL